MAGSQTGAAPPAAAGGVVFLLSLTAVLRWLPGKDVLKPRHRLSFQALGSDAWLADPVVHQRAFDPGVERVPSATVPERKHQRHQQCRLPLGREAMAASLIHSFLDKRPQTALADVSRLLRENADHVIEHAPAEAFRERYRSLGKRAQARERPPHVRVIRAADFVEIVERGFMQALCAL